MILSQTKLFNIFPSSIQLGKMLKILNNNCDRETIRYISARDLWINRLYFSLSNESKYSCLTIACRNPALQSIELMQTVTWNNFVISVKIKKTDSLINFLTRRVDTSNNSLIFQTDSVVNVTKNGETKIYKAMEELKSLVKCNTTMEKKEIVIDSSLQSNLNLLIENPLERIKK